MKKFAFILFLIIAFSFITQAQKPYSVENLEQASQEELDVYLDKAMKLQKSGRNVTIVGGAILGATAATIAGLIIIEGKDAGMVAAAVGFLGGLAGLGTMAVGIPMKATGKKRAERINTIKNTAYDGIKIDLKPCAQYNFATQNYQPGVTLRIRF